MCWLPGPSGTFSVSLAYKELQQLRCGCLPIEKFNQIWSVAIPPKAVVFLCRVHHNALPSTANLLRRNLVYADTSCPFCRLQTETISHILFTCKEVLTLWEGCFGWVNTTTVLLEDPLLHFNFIPCVLDSKEKVQRWRVVWSVIAWSIWNQKNGCVFTI